MYAEALAQRGDDVDVIALGQYDQQPSEIIRGVNVFRIQKRTRNERTKAAYLLRLVKFLLLSAATLSLKHLRNRYDIVHIHSVPDFEVFAALIPKLLGARIILDIHDIVPEFYASKFGVKKNSRVHKALVFVEKISCWFANHIIIANHLWWLTLTTRSAPESKCSVVLNYPNRTIFRRRPRARNHKKFIINYSGTFNQHQGLDIAIRAFALIKDEEPRAEFHIYGEGPERANLSRLVEKCGLNERIFLNPWLPIEAVVQEMADADLGVVPKRNDGFGGEAFSTKILEFMALGVPVIVAKTKVDEHYFNESVVKFFKPGDERALAQAMIEIIREQEVRDRLVYNANRFIEDYMWDKKQLEYLHLVDGLAKRI
jgi:glycosyltransferase involved in cell wall biosynthesis